ncbi:hypothetical protein F4678DRAFT_460553 [Xylaria arbuscula]|nr:hypothetical protein F4678DRAFT_460553 [Xylaria arbuscula]
MEDDGSTDFEMIFFGTGDQTILDPRTNGQARPVPEVLAESPYSAWIARSLVKADLSCFHPAIFLLMTTIGSQRCQKAVQAAQDVMQCLTSLEPFVQDLTVVTSVPMESGQLLGSLGRLKETCRALSIRFLNSKSSVMLLPYSIRLRVEMRFEGILQVLGDLLVHLDEYGDGLPFDSADQERLRYVKVVTDRNQLRVNSDLATRSLTCCLTPAMEFRGNWNTVQVAAFGQKERKGAEQSFIIAPDQDLIYVTDARHPELFLRLYRSLWCREVQRLALVVCDCRTGADWLSFDVAKKARLLWPGEPVFRLTKLKEIMLVARPRRHPTQYTPSDLQQSASQPRDAFGFVDYEAVRDNASAFTQEDVTVVDQTFDIFQDQLQKMLRQASRYTVIKFSRVVDIACNSLGMTDIEEVERNYYREGC